MMIKSCLLLATIVSFLQLAVQDAEPDMECGNKASNPRRMSLSINSKRNGTGEWETTFSALKNASRLSKNINLDVTHGSVECDGYQIVHIQGVIREIPVEGRKQPLLFHKKCSANAAIMNNGRTLHKIKMDGDGVGFTSRPLMDDELFEVRIDKKNSKLNHAIGIGVTTHSPTELDIPNHMNTLKSGTWMFYHNHLYQNGATTYLNFLKTNLKDVEVGQRVAVMRTSYGILQVFINGVDQGPAASNVPSPVYGYFELFGDVVQGTIVESTSITSS